VNGLAGAVVRAVVPFAAEPPFRLYAGPESDPIDVVDIGPLIKAGLGGESEFTFLVPGKARPVLVVSDSYDERVSELLALRLLRFSKLPDDAQKLVRDQAEPNLFHLSPDNFSLPEENAAIIASLVRVPHAALDPNPLGRLDENELRVVHERLAKRYQLDLHAPVMAELRRLGRQQRDRED
jgi:hypothetical protein